jgi:hypothetical protein
MGISARSHLKNLIIFANSERAKTRAILGLVRRSFDILIFRRATPRRDLRAGERVEQGAVNVSLERVARNEQRRSLCAA